MTPTTALVHSEETSCRLSLPGTFRWHLTQSHYPAWSASGQLYAAVDTETNSDYVKRFLECREYSWFARHKVTGQVRVLSSCCKLRWCWTCAQAKRTHLSHEIASWIRRTRYHKFMTLTLKHSEDPLKTQIDFLYKSFQKLRKSKFFKRHVKHGIWFFQIKRSKKTHEWHPHLHCIIQAQWIPYNELRNTWLKITKTSKVVDIRPITDPDGCANEVARYASAPANLEHTDQDDYFEIWKALHGRRICGTWGLKGQLQLTQKPAGDKDEWENVGTWSNVKRYENTCSKAQAIIKAWRDDSPLSPGIEVGYWEKNETKSDAELYTTSPTKYKMDLFDIPP